MVKPLSSVFVSHNKDELMAEVENETRQLKEKEFFPYKIMGTLIFSLLLSIVIEWGALPFNIGIRRAIYIANW